MERLRATNAPNWRCWAWTMPAVPAEIPHIQFAEAQELILRRTAIDVRGEPDLSPQDERWLGEWAQQLSMAATSSSSRATRWASGHFIPMPTRQHPAYSNSFDLIFRGTELVTGGQRLHRYADYLAALERARICPWSRSRNTWRRSATACRREGGFAIGLERLLMQLTGLPSVKLVTLFPRDLNRLRP